jgi:hypothetical protein
MPVGAQHAPPAVLRSNRGVAGATKFDQPARVLRPYESANYPDDSVHMVWHHDKIRTANTSGVTPD